MSSKAQIAANRRNAQESMGPRSVEGKRRSALNALKHGFTAKMALLPGEDPAQFDQFMEEMVASISPRGPLEHQLVLRAGGLLWRLRRIPSFEVALFERARGDIQGDPMGMNSLQLRVRKTIAKMDEDKRDVYELGALAHELLSHDILRRLTHYEVTLSRQLSQILLELHQLMASRPVPAKIEAPAVIKLPLRLQPEVLPSTGESAQRTGANPGDEPPFPD
jgi:hypothetical protein